MALLDDLQAVRALLANPDTRTRGMSAISAGGAHVRVNDPRAAEWDLHGAVIRVGQSPERREGMFGALESEVPDRNLKAFDAGGRSEAAVLAAVNRVIAAQQGQGQATERGI